MKRFWATDSFLALATGALLLLFAQTAAIRSLEFGAYDLGMRLASRSAGDQLAVIAIDEPSLQKLGSWPWSRDIHGRMIEILQQGGARVIGYNVLLSEPQVDRGLHYVNELVRFFDQSSLARQAPQEIKQLDEHWREIRQRSAAVNDSVLALEMDRLDRFYSRSNLRRRLPREIREISELLREAERTLNMDSLLSAQLQRAGNVVLPMSFQLGDSGNVAAAEPPDFVTRSAIGTLDAQAPQTEGAALPAAALSLRAPIPEFGEFALSLGHINVDRDPDGQVRSEPLLVHYQGRLYPSLALRLAAHHLRLSADQIRVSLGEGIGLGDRRIATDAGLRMRTFFYGERGGKPPFAVESFNDVLAGVVPAEKFRDKLVLVGTTLGGLGDALATPTSAALPPVFMAANSIASILNEHAIVVPALARPIEWGSFLLILLYLVSVLPRLRAGIGAMVSLVLLNVLIDSHFILMMNQGVWLQLMTPAALLVLGHTVLVGRRVLSTAGVRGASDAESAENNRMLGLAFQGQGQLDMAFEKFRKCPVDDGMLDLLYNLALDYERKRQYNKAGTVYSYMAEHKPDFRDIERRVQRAQQMDETGGLFSRTGPSQGDSAMVLDVDGVQKPMLGRYQVERVLGRGAMGVIYQGRDPKINRVVAIKTLALAQEFEEDELQEVIKRFFREAETAGRLNHPNIVTIYDAGEEQDLAYIAMEYLVGHDLTRYTKPGKLLPLPAAFHIVIKSAEALEFAHTQSVVHRDIKPGNILFEPKSGDVKITDFGIARITDSSKTRTGTVLGTPAYMSPEQLAGQRIDGRSDLFSLGVMFYQLVTGQLPFQGDSMASLMFKISNEQHLPAVSHNTSLDPCIDSILDRALAKRPRDRYQTGAEMARDLRACARRVITRGNRQRAASAQ